MSGHPLLYSNSKNC